MKIRKFLLLGALLALILIFYFGIHSPKEKDCPESILLAVREGSGVREIGALLEQEGIIRNSFYFNLYVLFSGKRKNLQAGSYFLCPSLNIPEIVAKMSLGETARRKVIVIEGWNLQDIAGYLSDTGIAGETEFLDMANNPEGLEKEFPFLKDKPEYAGLEGYLFPDTYFVSYSSGGEEIIREMLVNFGKKFTEEIREDIERNDKTIFNIVTMASLIEKEVRTYEDKRIVSGLLWKRMEMGMPLQVDATIAYITGRRTTKISIAETQIDSPYNTYKYRGLPIAPISNPGIDSIKAAVYPEKSDYLYYLSKPDGETIFSRTLEEHNVAKNKYLR